MPEKPKSNKMKKKELQLKKYFSKQQAVPLRQPVAYVYKTKVRNLAKTIEEIFAGTDNIRYNEHKIQTIRDAINRNKNDNFKRVLLQFVDQKVEFYEPANVHNNQVKVPLQALINISTRLDKAIRPVETWEATSHNTHRCISSFTRHLFAKYHVPTFMDMVWYQAGNRTHRDWFIHIGQGNNIRTAICLPVPLTKKEAHFFLEAPKDFTPLTAIRYGQIINMGGNEAFVRQILKTRISTDFDPERNKFWYAIFTWLMANPMLDTSHYAPILDYIHNQKYVGYRLNEQGVMVPRQPNFSMKGRDPEVLLRQVELWHRQVGRENRSSSFPEWSSCGRKGLYYRNKETLHTIRELCTQKELVEEGRKMHHCVGSYAGSCFQGHISIWSYEVMDENGINKKLTLEVENRYSTIRQARGKYNALPTASEMYFINMWAREANLTVSRYLI